MEKKNYQVVLYISWNRSSDWDYNNKLKYTMKILGYEINLRKLEQPKDTESRSAFSGFYGDALTFTNSNISAGASNLSAYYRGVDIISDNIAILPIKAMFRDGESNNVHPLNLILDNHYLLVKMLIESVINRGNGFAYIYRNPDGSVRGLRYLNPNDVSINYDKNRPERLSYNCSLVSAKPIEPCNMIHLKRKTVDGVNGVSIVSYASRTLGIAHATENAAKDFFSSGCNLSGVLTVQGNLSDAQRTQIRESWNSAYCSGGSGGIAILQGNMAYQPVQLNSEDSQLLQSRVFNVAEISRYLGISPVLLGDLTGASAYGSIEQIQQQFLLHTLQPYIVMIEEEFTEKLLKPSEKGNMRINLDEKALLRTDKSTQANYYSTLINSGILSVNEARKEMGYMPIENGDKHFVAFTDIAQNTIEGNNDGKDKGNNL